MNILKVQQEILKAVCANPENVKHFEFSGEDGETYIFLTVDGKVGYVLNAETVKVNLRGAQYMTNLSLPGLVKPENILNGTDDYRLKGTARRYTRVDDLLDDVYVDQSLLKLFDRPKLYQDMLSPCGVIAVTEDPMDSGEDVLVGIVMPCKVDRDSREA